MMKKGHGKIINICSMMSELGRKTVCANVAVSLANYGVDVAFVTKFPAHAIGQCALNALRRYGVDTSKIVRAATPPAACKDS